IVLEFQSPNTDTTALDTLSLHDALPISRGYANDSDHPVELYALLRERPRRHPGEGATGGHAGASTQCHARTGTRRRQQPAALRVGVERVNVESVSLHHDRYSARRDGELADPDARRSLRA